MFTLIIGDTETVVKNDRISASWKLPTANFLGDVIAILEKHFPNYDKDATTLSDTIIKHIKTELDGGKAALCRRFQNVTMKQHEKCYLLK